MGNIKKIIAVLSAAAIGCSLIACGGGTNGGNGGDEHTKHNWSSTYTVDGDRHYQTCGGCDEKQYNNHNYGTSGVCVCGKEKPADTHTSHIWSTTYMQDDDKHYQTCSGCDEKQYNDHDYGTSGVCICGKTKPDTSVAATGVVLDKANIELTVGGEGVKLTATVQPENATDKSVTYSVEPAGVVSVDNDGNVTAIAEGTAVITVKTANDKTATCNVTVTAPITNAEVIAALEEFYMVDIAQKCLPSSSITVEKSRVQTMNWFISQNNDGKITGIEYIFIYVEDNGNAYCSLGSATFGTPITAQQLKASKSNDVTYTRVYRFNYDANIQQTRAALTDAICDKVFGENEGIIRFIKDNGAKLDTTLNQVRDFTVIEITENCVKEKSIYIKSSTTDTGYINMLSNTSNYKIYDEKSYNISGAIVLNNNSAFSN